MENSYEKATTQSVANSLNEKPIQNKAIALQDNRPASILQRKANNTGLPDNLKSGIESLSGHSMDDVKVHYNSDKPAQLNAHAYAQGTNIHIASGQEKHLPHEAWHVVQQKQGRVKPTLQMKGKVNVNDDKGLEKEADVMGAKALQMKSETESVNSENKITATTSIAVQRKVLIEGVPKAPPVEGAEGAPAYQPKNATWLSDDYIRNYISNAEYEAHDSGRPVKCGLLEDVALWYRLPFPSAIPGAPESTFFLIGENHGYTPIKSLLKASNQQGAKTLVESSAVFRKTKMGDGEGVNKNLSILANPDYSALHQIELGLAKALHAFAYMRAPTEEQRTTAQPATNTPYPIGDAPKVEVEKIISVKDQTIETWRTNAGSKPRYRDAYGTLYYIEGEGDKAKGIRRPKSPAGNSYKQDESMETFLKKPEILEALPAIVRAAYTAVVESKKEDRKGETYTDNYTKAFAALRIASRKNITTVYPDLKDKDMVERAGAAEMAPEALKGDSEMGMKHRNVVMLAGLKRAITEGGYAVASLGALHVQDIAAWQNKNEGLPILIITYDDFIKKYSKEAE